MNELSLREIQAGMLEILKKLDSICTEQHLTYHLAWGTLLGAVRHQGFIPWDDDLDVTMPRPDYDKLIDYLIAHEEALLPFRLMHYRTNPRYIYPIARLCDTRYRVDYTGTRDYGLGLFVDIYPLDGGGSTEDAYKACVLSRQRDIQLAFQSGMQKFEKSARGWWRTPFKLAMYACARCHRPGYYARKLDAQAHSIPYDTSRYVGVLIWDCQMDPFPKEWFAKTVRVPFEDLLCPVPLCSKEILSASYGDFMLLPPEEERQGHHNYKAYKL